MNPKDIQIKTHFLKGKPSNNPFPKGHKINNGRKYSEKQRALMQRKRAATLKERDPGSIRYEKAKATYRKHKEAGLLKQRTSWCKGKTKAKEWSKLIKQKAIERHFTDKMRPEICRMYIEEKMSTKKIADKIGTGRQVIAKRLREEGVTLRGPSESLKGRTLSEEHIRKCLRRRIPTSLENRFLEIVERNGLPYKYVGDGSFMVAGKNPDFININGAKIAVEVYAEFYKKLNGRDIKAWRRDRKKLFQEYGWDLLFFSQKQVTEDHVVNVLMKKN